MRHPKFLALSGNAIALWHEGKDYCDEHMTDGLIPSAAMKGFRFRGAKPIGMLTTSCGPRCDGTAYTPLWEAHPVGYKMHDYLDHNPCREDVLARMEQAEESRAVDRDRLQRWRDAKKLKRGETALHETVPETRFTGVSETLYQKSTEEKSTEKKERTYTPPTPSRRTLVTPQKHHRNVAHFSPLGDVPNFIHSEFIGKVVNGGADEVQADKQVRAFYADVEGQFQGQVVGDEPMVFWRERFKEKWGTTKRDPRRPAWAV